MDRPEPDVPLPTKLAHLLKAGAASAVIATATVSASAATPPAPAPSLQDRIEQARQNLPPLPPGTTANPAADQAYWGNWHNGGWHNGGWHNWHNWGNHW